MERLNRILYITAFLLYPIYSIASESWRTIADTIHIEQNKVLNRFVLDSVLPYDTTKALMVLPVQNDSDKSVYDLHLILKSAANNNIFCHYVDSSKIFISKKKHLSHIKYDFANFKLNNDTRAFGVRIQDSTSSDIFMIKNEFISLYAINKKKNIVKVLDNALISSLNDQWNLQNCEGDHFSESKIIVMSRKKKKKTTDFRDIIIKNRVVTVKNFIKRDSLMNDSIMNDSMLIHKQKIAMSKNESTISFNDGDVVALNENHEMIMHDKLNDIEKVNADSLAKILDDEKTMKENMVGEELDNYKLEHINDNNGECIESITIEWMREYYVFKNGQYMLTAEPK